MEAPRAAVGGLGANERFITNRKTNEFAKYRSTANVRALAEKLKRPGIADSSRCRRRIEIAIVEQVGSAVVDRLGAQLAKHVGYFLAEAVTFRRSAAFTCRCWNWTTALY